MKDGKPESLAEALLLLEKLNARLSEKDQKIREQQAEIKILNERLAVKRAREFASKTESLKKLYESQPFLFDAEEMGLKLENQCPEISDEDIVQSLSDDDLFDRKSERKKPGRTRNKSKNLPRQKYVIDLSEFEETLDSKEWPGSQSSSSGSQSDKTAKSDNGQATPAGSQAPLDLICSHDGHVVVLASALFDFKTELCWTQDWCHFAEGIFFYGSRRNFTAIWRGESKKFTDYLL